MSATRGGRGRQAARSSRKRPARRPPARRPGARRRRRAARRRGTRGRSRLPLLVGALGVAAVAFGVSRIDFGDAIREVTLPLRHDDIIRQQADRFDIDPALIAAVIKQESDFRDQTSSAGARGLMQITPETADTIETLSGGETFVYDDLADPELNIRYGTFYLDHLIDRFEGNELAALAGYNGGPENAAAWGGAALELDDIAFAETRDYVEHVLEYRGQYRDNYAEDLGID